MEGSRMEKDMMKLWKIRGCMYGNLELLVKNYTEIFVYRCRCKAPACDFCAVWEKKGWVVICFTVKSLGLC